MLSDRFINGVRDEEDEYEKMKAQYEAMLALSQGAVLPEEEPYVPEPGRQKFKRFTKDQIPRMSMNSWRNNTRVRHNGVALNSLELTRQAAAQEAQYAGLIEEEEEDEAARLEREYNQLKMQYESMSSFFLLLNPNFQCFLQKMKSL